MAHTEGEQWQVLKRTIYSGSDPFRSTDISQFMKSHSAADKAYAVFFFQGRIIRSCAAQKRSVNFKGINHLVILFRNMPLHLPE